MVEFRRWKPVTLKIGDQLVSGLNAGQDVLAVVDFRIWNTSTLKTNSEQEDTLIRMDDRNELVIEYTLRDPKNDKKKRLRSNIELRPDVNQAKLEGLTLAFSAPFKLASGEVPARTLLCRKGAAWGKVSAQDAFDRWVASIARAATEGKREVRLSAVRALGDIGQPALRYVPVLIKALRDDGEKDCILSLKKLTGQDFGPLDGLWRKWWEKNRARLLNPDRGE